MNLCNKHFMMYFLLDRSKRMYEVFMTLERARLPGVTKCLNMSGTTVTCLLTSLLEQVEEKVSYFFIKKKENRCTSLRNCLSLHLTHILHFLFSSTSCGLLDRPSVRRVWTVVRAQQSDSWRTFWSFAPDHYSQHHLFNNLFSV